jgi:hypothetical protein
LALRVSLGQGAEEILMASKTKTAVLRRRKR